MKNKYQEALQNLYDMRSKLIDVSSKNAQWVNNIEKYDFIGEQLATLQELVDEKIPVKVDKSTKGSFPNYDNYETSHTTYKCPKCNCTIHLDWHEKRNFCAECGTKLDWSDENEC